MVVTDALEEGSHRALHVDSRDYLDLRVAIPDGQHV